MSAKVFHHVAEAALVIEHMVRETAGVGGSVVDVSWPAQHALPGLFTARHDHELQVTPTTS
ncbi:MAG: hypothetical protein R3C27_14720 [Hyphomonadaceae bacterium]